MNLLAHAKAERDRWAKIVALLEAAPSTTPSPSAKPKSKNSPSSKAYWTPARRKAMSDKIKALQKKSPAKKT